MRTRTTPFPTGHVGLNVTRLDQSRDFYQRSLALRVMHEGEVDGSRFVFLGDGHNILLTLWEQSTEGFDPGRAGLHHLSFEVSDLATLQEAEDRLRSAGVEILYDGIVPHMETAESAALFFRDPDGLRLELYSPTGASELEISTTTGPTCGFF